MRHVFTTMGTMASIELPEPFASEIAALREIFAATDERFSLYAPQSELSRIASGALTLPQSSRALRDSFERSMKWYLETSGLFSPNRPDGVIDLNGIVKAEAIESAGAHLDGAGCSNWSINVGGDILVRTAHSPWTIGIADSAVERSLSCSISLLGTRRAVATSGSAQRGDHIWRGGRLGPTRFVQVSVIADDIVTADVLATAIIAGGQEAIDDVADRWPVDVLAVDRDGELMATPGFRAAIAR